MAMVMGGRFKGDMDEMLSQMNDRLLPVSAKYAERHGGLLSVMAKTGDDEILLLSIWLDADGNAAMSAEPEFQEAAKLGGPTPAETFKGELLGLRYADSLADLKTHESDPG